MTDNHTPEPADTTPSTAANEPTTKPESGARQSRAWHDRASGDLSSWGATYNPTSEAAARAWRAHHDQIEPWIAATNPAGVTEARRVASAVLELLAWAMPHHNDVDTCMTEETLQQFLLANPTGLGAGALANVRGRVRRVLRARAAMTTAQPPAPVAVPGSSVEAAATAVVPEEFTAAADKSAGSAPEPARRAYDETAWARLNRAAEDDEGLRAVLSPPWHHPTPAQWQHARAVAAGVGIDLRQDRLRLTIWAHALTAPAKPLARLLAEHAISARAATQIAALLPVVDEQAYIRALRGEGHCTGDQSRHPAGQLSTAPSAEDAPTTNHPTGGATVMSLNPVAEVPIVKPEPKRRRKPSARQARLAAAEARREAAERATSLPESMRVYIREVYEPLPPIRDEWTHLKDAVEATLAASTVRGEDSMRKHVTHLAHFFAWARGAGLPLGPASLTRGNLSIYESEALTGVGRSTRQNRRSRLNSVADQIHPEQAPIKGPPMPHRQVAAPYTAAEMAVIRRVAQVQPTPLLKRQVCLLTGLGAGAGIDSSDVKRLHGRDITDHGADGIEVRVTNLRRSRDNSVTAHQRTVWVLREYEDLVRIGIQGVKPNQLLLGRDAERANVAAGVFERAALHGDVPDLAQSRLRSTWMATHLSRPTPLQVLLRAAGLTTARTLVELLPHLPEPLDASERLR